MSRNSQVLVLNQNNVVKGTNNTKYEYVFNQPQTFKGKEISVNQINIYYSWFNINSQLYNNNSFQYKWFDASGNLSQIYSVVFPDGYYDITTINKYIRSVMAERGHCFIKTNGGDITYFFEIRDNPTYYSFEIILTPIPTTLPAGMNAISGWKLPGIQSVMQIIFNTTNNFYKLIGFNQGTYPPQGTPVNLSYRANSNFVPAISPITSLTLRCNMVRNELSPVPDLLYSFTQGTNIYGNIMSIEPKNPLWLKVNDGNYTSLIIQFFDQEFKPVYIVDPDILLVLSIRDIE